MRCAALRPGSGHVLPSLEMPKAFVTCEVGYGMRTAVIGYGGALTPRVDRLTNIFPRFAMPLTQANGGLARASFGGAETRATASSTGGSMLSSSRPSPAWRLARTNDKLLLLRDSTASNLGRIRATLGVRTSRKVPLTPVLGRCLLTPPSAWRSSSSEQPPCKLTSASHPSPHPTQ